MSELPNFTRGGPTESPEPQKAPPNFRELPPCEKQPVERGGDDSSTVYVGSGVPFGEHPLASGWYSKCGACGSNDTLCLYADLSMRDGGHFTRWVWTHCEYLCRRCGRFTSYGTFDERD